MPLTMEPNFDDFSCEMVFGQLPPLMSNDDVMHQGCLSECPAAELGGPPCHKLQ